MRAKQILASLAVFALGAHASPLTIDATTSFQKVEGFGGAMAWYQDWVTKNPNKALLYDTLFRGSGLSILRLGNWVDNVTTTDMSVDSQVVAEALKRNPGIRILTSSWSPPAALKANGSTKGPYEPNTLALNAQGNFVYDLFGGWWKKSVARMAQAGIHPTWISIQNESDFTSAYESCRFDPLESKNASAVALANPSFESGTGSWYFGAPNTDAVFTSVTGDAKAGSYAGKVEVKTAYPTESYKIQLQLPTWNVQANSKYLVRFWAKGTGDLQVAGWNAAQSTWMPGFTTTLTGAWTQVSGVFTTGSLDVGTDVKLNLYLGASVQTWLFDDFQVSFAPIAGIGPAVRAVSDSLATLPAANRPLVLGPEVMGIANNSLEDYAAQIDPSTVGGYAFHLYKGGSFLDPGSFAPTMDLVGGHLTTKPMFMSEYYNQEGTDTTKDFWRLAWIMQESFTRMNLAAWIYWDMAWDNGSMVALSNPNVAYPASAPLGFQIRKTFYAQAQFSRFVKPGWMRVSAVAADTALKAVAFVSPQKDSLSLVVVNPWAADVTMSPAVNIVPSSATLWITDLTRSLVSLGNWTTGQTVVVPAHSVLTIAMALQASSSSSSAQSSSSSATTALQNGQPALLGSGVVAYHVYDMTGQRVRVSNELPTNLPQGRWIIVAVGANGQKLGSWVAK